MNEFEIILQIDPMMWEKGNRKGREMVFAWLGKSLPAEA